MPDVYTYDTIPEKLRVQLVHILQDSFGQENRTEYYAHMHKALCREYGVFSLAPKHEQHSSTNLMSIANYLLSTQDVEHVLDIVELFLRTLDSPVRESQFWRRMGTLDPDKAIAEVNTRFREHGVGFEYVSGELIRIDSQLVHSEVVKPALQLLKDKRFVGANQEFLSAHEHYRHARYKECLVDCLKAFESTMKIVCSIKGWQYKPTDTAKNLIEICVNNGLFASFLQSQLGSLRSILESGVPTVRNKLAGHGQGSGVTNVTEQTARYSLHLTAANILLVIESL